MLGSYLSDAAFVGALRGLGDAVFAIVIPPGLDGPPSEADGVAVLVLEGHGADVLVAGEQGFSRGVFECSEHSHFDVVADAFHVAAQRGTARGAGVDGRLVLSRESSGPGGKATTSIRQRATPPAHPK